ncbi:hypothetical protein HNW13_018140 [Shewanella sp. BF02_Schw]|uniref:hypothetical protein n=1 Tax=Shewanella sp. BF02_Schw TaxID=394908 RepID=UPI00178696E0|nr:hypothetical protein [Shewanella sp. BF02_Schw]MBO1897661.1 hypothetical protein [Shewanella sp. BF02_Schw]
MKSIKGYLTKFTNKMNATYFAFVALMLMPGTANAAGTGVQGILVNIQNLFQVGGQTIIAGSFVVGLGFAGMAFFLFKGAGEPNGQNKGVWLSIILCAFAAGGLMYLGASAYTFGDTLFNSDGSASSIDKTKYGL